MIHHSEKLSNLKKLNALRKGERAYLTRFFQNGCQKNPFFFYLTQNTYIPKMKFLGIKKHLKLYPPLLSENYCCAHIYRVLRKYCPPWPEKMSNLVIKCRLHIERYIQYDLFEPKKMIMKCLFSTWRTIYYMYDFSRNIVEKYPKAYSIYVV